MDGPIRHWARSFLERGGHFTKGFRSITRNDIRRFFLFASECARCDSNAFRTSMYALEQSQLSTWNDGDSRYPRAPWHAHLLKPDVLSPKRTLYLKTIVTEAKDTSQCTYSRLRVESNRSARSTLYIHRDRLSTGSTPIHREDARTILRGSESESRRMVPHGRAW